MGFIEKIKKSIEDRENGRGLRGKTVVDTRALIELINAFEALDSAERVEHNKNMKGRIRHTLAEALEALYRDQDRHSDLVMEIVMHTLKPLMEEKYQQKVLLSRR